MLDPCAPMPRPRVWRRVLGRHHHAHHAGLPCVAPVKGGMAKALAFGLLGAGALAGGVGAGAAYGAWQARHTSVLDPFLLPAVMSPVAEMVPVGDGAGFIGHPIPPVPQPVPEPMGLVIFGEALAGLAVARLLTRGW